MKYIQVPFTDPELRKLKKGDEVLISGTLYCARDAALKRICASKKLPVDIKGQGIFFMGPTPARPGKIIGSAGPTTSARMDKFSAFLISRGLKAIIGKGAVSDEVIQSLKKHKAVYFAAIGGAGALISKSITSCKTVLYPELGPEAVLKITVRNLPVIVAVDVRCKK